MFSDLLEGVTITARSPDGNLTCELEDGRNVVIDFTPGSYRRYTERELGHQLASLATSIWVAHRRAHLAVLSDRAGYPVRGDESHGDRRSREFVEERARVRAEGRSRSGRIVTTTVGMARWEIRIKPGTVRELDEEDFLNDLWSTFPAVVADYQGKVGRLKEKVFAISQSGDATRPPV